MEVLDHKIRTQEADIFLLEDGSVAKVYRGLSYSGKSMEDRLSAEASMINEESVARELYENGRSVPKPYGIRNLTIPLNLLYWHNPEGSIDVPAFVMEHIPGVNGLVLLRENILEYNLALRMAEKEFEACRNLGFFSHDAAQFNVSNFIWTPKKKVVLIDFSSWIRTRTK